jgi:hypothetical protein
VTTAEAQDLAVDVLAELFGLADDVTAWLDGEESSIARRAVDGDAELLAVGRPRAELAPAPRGSAPTGGSR